MRLKIREIFLLYLLGLVNTNLEFLGVRYLAFLRMAGQNKVLSEGMVLKYLLALFKDTH